MSWLPYAIGVYAGLVVLLGIVLFALVLTGNTPSRPSSRSRV